MTAGPPSDRTRIRREPERAVYEQAEVKAILDAGLVAHVGFVDPDGGFPVVQPMAYGRIGDVLYLHGSSGARQLRALATGTDVCVTVTHLDGLVLARSGFNHSMNYRCAIVLGRTRLVTDENEVAAALDEMVDRLVEGRAAHLRPLSRRERSASIVVAVGLEESSAKVRTGPTDDDEADLDWPVWTGVLPLTQQRGEPEPDAGVTADLPGAPA
jgi:nitroimidazol reductase NimA-like FMN-containing flavoprotein (pyridoxamine 5'-phosphate oxidase superfamily)